ncbi:hypothetical protein ACFY93_10065 [Streptomyces sp. NPDC008313]|uniref:hypothetical protein n=1 Tax=Streptomyces sp. NPDC008313 TaxID=3364826 RepID=UPI0036E0AB87
MTDSSPSQSGPDSDRRTAERLIPAWLAEAARHEPRTARDTEQEWRDGQLSGDAARELAHWVTARVTDTAFNEDEGPTRDGPATITVADKEAVHRWLRSQGHDV